VVPAGAPETIAESGEEQRGRFSSHAREGQQAGRQMPRVSGRQMTRGNPVFSFTGAESHGPPSRKALGTARRNSSVLRSVIGIIHQAERESSGERREML